MYSGLYVVLAEVALEQAEPHSWGLSPLMQYWVQFCENIPDPQQRGAATEGRHHRNAEAPHTGALHGPLVQLANATRIETQAGHGAGKPTSKIIEERGDALAFIANTFKLEVR